MRDPRNALWRRYVDALEKVSPKFFILENVANFLQSGQFRDFRRETYRNGKLRKYRIECGILNAANYGAPQARKRAVVIGSLRDMPQSGLPPPSVESQDWLTVRDVIGTVDFEVVGVALTQARTKWRGRSYPGLFKTTELHLGRRPTQLSLDRYAAIPPGGNRRDLPEHLMAPCWRNHRTGSGDVMGRLRWDKPSVTIRTEFWKPEKGRYLHPQAHRPITHYEAALIQGFPEDYLWLGSKAKIGQQIGNAVPVPLARAIAQHIGNVACGN